MKIIRLLSPVVLAGAILLFASCGGGNTPTPSNSKEKTQLNLLKGTWTLSSVMQDGSENGNFTGVTMTISGNYTADGGTYNIDFSGTMQDPSPWAKSGTTFTFGSNPESQLTRDDQTELTYSVTANTLTINFTYNGSGFSGGRVSHADGAWEFDFTK